MLQVIFCNLLLDYIAINVCFTIVSLSREKKDLSSSKFILYALSEILNI